MKESLSLGSEKNLKLGEMYSGLDSLDLSGFEFYFQGLLLNGKLNTHDFLVSIAPYLKWEGYSVLGKT